MVIVIETAIIIIILIIIWRIPTYQYLFDIFILMITINLEKTHQILNNNYNYENISYLEYINTIIIMRWQ